MCLIPKLIGPQGTPVLGVVIRNPVWGMPGKVSRDPSRSWNLVSRVSGLVLGGRAQKFGVGVQDAA